MRRRALAFLLLSLSAAAPAADPDQRCRDLPRVIDTKTAASVMAVGPTMCEYTGLPAGLPFLLGRIERLIIDTPANPGELPPASLHAEAHGVLFTPQDRGPIRMPPLNRFIFDLVARPISLSLDYRWGADGVLTIEEATYNSRTVGTVMLSAVLDGVPRQLETAGTTARLRSLRLHVDGRGFFESTLFAFTLGALSGQPDIEAAFIGLKAQAAALAQQALGGGAASPASLKAVMAYIDALPNPTQPLDIAIELPDPLPLATLADRDRLGTALPPGSVIVNYGP